MPAAALALALGSAGLHAAWNLLLAGTRDTEAAVAAALPLSALLAAPLALAFWRMDGPAWPFVGASSVLEVAYFALLAAAYRRTDLSIVYTLARGLAPVLLLAGSVAVGALSPSGGEVAGVLLVAAGVLAVRGLRRGRGAVFGIAIACCIAGYTALDKHGVAYASPVAYLEVMTVLSGGAYTAGFVALRGPRALRAAFGWRTAVAGAAVFGAYALVLAALRLAPAASVAAVRETSVVVAAALAAVVLKERVTPVRLGGAVLVAGGVALLALS